MNVSEKQKALDIKDIDTETEHKIQQTMSTSSKNMDESLTIRKDKSLHSLGMSTVSNNTDEILMAQKAESHRFLGPGSIAATTNTSSTGMGSEEGNYSVANSIRAGLKTSELRRQKMSNEVISLHSKIQSKPSAEDALNFESLALIGRDKELSELKACFARMISEEDEQDASEDTVFRSHKELILIGGESGVGKTSVAKALKGDVSLHKNGLFAHGEFDINTINEPYSGISKTFGSICRIILKDRDEESICAVRKALERELGDEIGLLLNLIPDLDVLLRDKNDTSSAPEKVGDDAIESGLDRLRFAFRVLTSVLCATFSPLVLFVDGLQWADISSLQILDYIMSDAQNEHPLMIIGCYRSDEVGENSLLHNKMVALREKSTKYKFCMTEMIIGAFGVDDIEKIIREALPSSDPKETVGLAELCLKRTFGNPFFVFEFLKMLHQEGLLVYCASQQIWTWNLAEIEKESMSTLNVVVMLQQHMSKLPKQVQAVLQCATYLGSTFGEAALSLVWSSYGRRLVAEKVQPISVLLESIVKENIFERGDNKQYRWVHGKVQEAALSLIGKVRESFQLDIATTLYYGMKKSQVEEDLFAIVDLMNRGNVSKRPEFARCNLRAAEKAREMSAFRSAAEYAAHGIRLLKEIQWFGENRSISFKLFRIGVETEIVLGNIAAAEKYTNEVLSRSDISPSEIIPFKMAEANVLSIVEVEQKEALECYTQLLTDLGYRLIWRRSLLPIQAFYKLFRTIKKAKSKPQGFYDTMVPIDDPRHRTVSAVLARVIYNAFRAGNTPLLLLCTSKLVDLTLDNGVNEFSARSFAILGAITIMALKDYETATSFNMVALSMIKKFRGMHNAETTVVAYQVGLCWVKPFEECVVPSGDAVLAGLRAGETEDAILSLLAHSISFPYAAGKPLNSILEHCPKVLFQCEESSRADHILMVRTHWQMLINLTDPSCSNPSALEGNIYSAEKDNGDFAGLLSAKTLFLGELLLVNDDYEVTAKRAIEIGNKYAKLVPGYFMIMPETFHRAVALYAAALLTKKRKYIGHARKLKKTIYKWAKAGNPNVQYYHMFLTAEQLALDKKYDLAEQKYEEAIETVMSVGHLHHIALLNERYADFLINERSLEEKSKDRLKQAIHYYKELGAARKVKALESRLYIHFG